MTCSFASFSTNFYIENSISHYKLEFPLLQTQVPFSTKSNSSQTQVDFLQTRSLFLIFIRQFLTKDFSLRFYDGLMGYLLNNVTRVEYVMLSLLRFNSAGNQQRNRQLQAHLKFSVHPLQNLNTTDFPPKYIGQLNAAPTLDTKKPVH